VSNNQGSALKRVPIH
jgi:hypothetical protein